MVIGGHCPSLSSPSLLLEWWRRPNITWPLVSTWNDLLQVKVHRLPNGLRSPHCGHGYWRSNGTSLWLIAWRSRSILKVFPLDTSGIILLVLLPQVFCPVMVVEETKDILSFNYWGGQMKVLRTIIGTEIFYFMTTGSWRSTFLWLFLVHLPSFQTTELLMFRLLNDSLYLLTATTNIYTRDKFAKLGRRHLVQFSFFFSFWKQFFKVLKKKITSSSEKKNWKLLILKFSIPFSVLITISLKILI